MRRGFRWGGGGDLTTLVVLITNYVLGFLGLTAITAIIYAGILYVANFGNDEMTGKAKTIIIYVSVGIVVILLSYAIVTALVGVAGTGAPGGRGIGGVGSPGRISVSDQPVTTLDSLFDVEGKDFVFPLLTTLRDLGDLCPHTPIGLGVNNSGCAQNELVPDTDSDGVANVLDKDDDNDGVNDEDDFDSDGDGVCDGDGRDSTCSGGPDMCPDTLSFVTFKVSDLERRKLQIDRVDQEGYDEFVRDNQGCGEYERKSDIDGDGLIDLEDCDADADGLIDNAECDQAFFETYRKGNPDGKLITPDTVFRGVVVLDVIRGEIDDDDDDDGIIDFGSGLRSDARDLLLRQLANNFSALEGFIRITCATLPQTQKVLDYCGYNPQGEPFGKLVRLLDDLSSDLTFVDFDAFNTAYQEFLAIAQAFPRVRVRIQASQFEGFLPPDNSPLRISFDASQTVDPFQEFCPIDDENYFWFVNKTLDFSQGLPGILNSTLNPPDATGVFFDYDFNESGIFNIQLLVRSACKFNVVNPGAGEREDVDASIAGLANARISVFPPRARLIVSVNGIEDQGNQPVRILTGTQTPISFDLTQSITSRGGFEFLNYDCGNGVSNSIQGSEVNWTFDCSYTDATGTKVVRLQARDGEGDVGRIVSLQFNEVIAFLQVSPGVRGTTTTVFNFDGSRSQAAQQISNFTFVIDQKRGTTFAEVDRFQDQTVSYQFPAPGEYRVTLEVSTGGAASQVSSDSVLIIIDEQDPIAAFKTSFPETIRPARVLLDGSLSFHPDFPDQDVLSYVWEVDGVTLSQQAVGSTGPFTYQQATAGSDARVFFEFQTVGEHDIALTVAKGDGQDKVTDTVTVETLLGVDFTVDLPAARIDEVITFTPESDKALGYFWDFGDGDTLVANDEPVVHIYQEQGEYSVTLRVEDAVGNTNSIEKVVRVGLQNAPVSFLQVFVSNIEQDLTASGCIEVTRRDNVVFDAGKSVNVRGEGAGLSFLWEIEDFEEIVRTRTFTRIFKDLTRGGCIDVDLTITDFSTQAIDEAETVSIEVVNIPPEITDVRYSVTEQELVTPVTATVSAIGIRDLDGRVARYRWWYFEEGQGQRKLDTRVTDIPRTTFVIGPNNVEGTETTYFFAVEVEDNDGAVTSSLDALGPSEPLVVTNGPNVAPVAEFVTNRSTVQTEELISFSSTTVDPLGEFIPSAAYQWDFEGDGEYERGISGPKVTHRYTKPGLFTPTLRVTKHGLSSQYDMNIRVLPSTKEPEAAFIFVQSGAKVKFISNSSVDPALEDKDLQHAWDFDTTIDTDGNGIPDDDTDSALLAPVFEFEGDKNVLVGLTVTDSVSSRDTVVRRIPFIKEDRDRGPLGATKKVAFRASLTTNPLRNEVDGRLYLRPPFSDVVFNAQKSIGKIQEYRLDTNIFVDSDGDEIPDNDIDNKTHKSWKDGSSFKRTYREVEGRIRAKLTVVSLEGLEKTQVVEIVFAEEEPTFDLDALEDPDAILSLLETIPVVSFDVSSAFAKPGETLQFDASMTRFPDEKVEEYRWDFDGDGLVEEISFEPLFSYSYEEDGVFEVILEAVSDGGLQGEYTQTVFIRGGLELPVANFDFELRDNEVLFTNTSTVDSSLPETETEYEWTFKRIDLGTALEWETWLIEDDVVIEEREFNQPPLWVKDLLHLESAETGTGVLPREVVLGADQLVVRFPEGTTLVDEEAQPFVGELQLVSGEDSSVSVEGEQNVAVYDTGLDQVLSSSDEIQLIFNGVLFEAKLYQLIADAEPELLGEGKVEENLTRFTVSSFGGRYLLTGDLESAGGEEGLLLGVSTVQNPVKVFPDAGLYQVTLQVKDSVGETNEKQELITIDQNLEIVEAGTVVPEDILSVDGIDKDIPQPDFIPEPVIVSDDEGGFSYFWIVFILVIILVVGAITFIVIKTIRRRQEELDTGGAKAPPAGEAPPEVIEPEIVQPAPPVQQPPAAGKAEEKEEVKEVKEVKDSKASEEDKDKEDKGGGGPAAGGEGPIPDWLKG